MPSDEPWIRVEDELPYGFELMWTYTPGFPVTRAWYAPAGKLFTGPGWYSEHGDGPSLLVTHWRRIRIPAPPEERTGAGIVCTACRDDETEFCEWRIAATCEAG